jgi:predicted esterase
MLLRQGGADVTIEWRMAGHGLTAEDVANARSWLAVA